jgi:solute:Na+ symporter, SSS family
MPDLSLNTIDYTVFWLYMILSVGLGFAVARKARGNPTDYFLGEKKLPWYVVGTSMVASDISSETFIANVGIAYLYGMVAATGGWNAWIIYSIFIFIFLPYYVRRGLYTMPQFLERRYNSACRYLFAISLVIGYVFTLLAGSLYAGGLAVENIFDIDIHASMGFGDGVHDRTANIMWGIVLFAIVTGAYTIYGGMKSAAWTDFMQMMVLLLAGVLLPILALVHVGGLAPLARDFPQHFDLFLPPEHEQFPWTGVFTGFLTVGLWYTCASQHIVQRVLSAKDEWHARMGVVSAGFLRIITPLFFVIPGIAALQMFPGLKEDRQQDQAYLLMVKALIPTGLKGLVLAGMAAALMSTVSTALNSTATLLTIDLYKKVVRPKSSDREQVIFGMIIALVVLIISIWVAFDYIHSPHALFRLVQRIFFYIAPPFAVVFTLGLIWRRANGTAALATIIGGFLFLLLLEQVLWDRIEWLTPYRRAYQHSALLTWIVSMIIMVSVSLLTNPPPREKTEGIIWNRSYLKLPEEMRQRYGGWKDFRLWWLGFIGIVLAIYGFFVWFDLSR